MLKRISVWVSLTVLTATLWLTAAPGALALTAQQQLVMEAWRIVNRAYVDETFNHQNWWFVRQQALKKPLNTWEDAYGAVQAMLVGLDDPYTRFLPPDQYRSLQTSTSGELLGIGLQIAKEDIETDSRHQNKRDKTQTLHPKPQLRMSKHVTAWIFTLLVER